LRTATLVCLACAACTSPEPAVPGDAAAGADAAPEVPEPCPVGPAGLACAFALHDQVRADCERLADFSALIAARRGELPLWHDGRALFVSEDEPVAPAGDWNGWTPGPATEPLCGGDLHTAEIAIASGRHQYKLVVAGDWRLDPLNHAFAWDDFAGNPERKNSVLNTHDSGLGHLVQPDQPICSDELGGCRPLTAYLPPGYGAPDAPDRYPALFMHDGQNVFDDPACCFGFGGWQINDTLDAEIGEGRVAPVVVVGFDHGGPQRLAEYGGELSDEFIELQVGTVQPAAAARWRIDPGRVYTAGSSLGGLVSFRLALAHPEVYAGAASLSGSFFVTGEDGLLVRQLVAEAGVLPLALYLDHGGTAAGGGDNYGVNRELLEALDGAGWPHEQSPECASGPGRVCYFHADGASHDEVAWRERSWRFLRFFFPR
jgi:enterochelin esterase-like enzyme